MECFLTKALAFGIWTEREREGWGEATSSIKWVKNKSHTHTHARNSRQTPGVDCLKVSSLPQSQCAARPPFKRAMMEYVENKREMKKNNSFLKSFPHFLRERERERNMKMKNKPDRRIREKEREMKKKEYLRGWNAFCGRKTDQREQLGVCVSILGFVCSISFRIQI